MKKIKAENKRFIVFYLICGVFFCAILSRLYLLQIVEGEENKKKSDSKLSLAVPVKAPRGEICDRFGRVLVTNKSGFYLAVEKINETEEERNRSILNALKILISHNEYERNAEYEDLSHLYKKYNIDDSFTQEEKELLAGVRSDMEKSGFSVSEPYALCDDLSYELVTVFKENSAYFKNIKIYERPKREYLYPETAVHILGRTGKISKEELEEPENEGADKNDYIGKQGAEKAFQKYLKGTDGIKSYEENLKLKNSGFINSVDAVPGDAVMLTIDLDLQIATEEALKKASQNISKTENIQTNGGAAVAIDVNSGEILASASYPAYNIASFSNDYKKLSENKALPMFNRSFQGLYEPGSTFKPITAIAAIDNNNLEPEEKIKTLGKYEYKNHTFLCNTYKKEGKTHGTINVADALAVSCNYFFFEAGKRCGIEKISETAESFGLGDVTGVEFLKEEAKGKIATPELRKNNGGTWYPGDTLQAAIGQSDNLFTPLALANYGAALANGGTVYKTSILKAVKSYGTNEIIIENEPKINGYAKASNEALSVVKEGMLKVCQKGGTAGAVFQDFPVSVCAKTGSAEVNGGTNGIFLCYAPAENPQIAVSVVLEKGGSGVNAAKVAKEILLSYFEKSEKKEEKKEETAPYELVP